MRILHISSAKTFGGGEKHLVDLCRGLKEAGHDVFVAVRPTCEWKSRLSFLPDERICTVSIRNSFGLLSSKRLASFVRTNRIEIIHAHLGRDYITASIVARLVSPLKCVLTRHVLFPLKTFNRFVLANVDRIIAVSEDVRMSLSGIFETRKIRVIYNGSDSVMISTDERADCRNRLCTQLKVQGSTALIGLVGTISEVKGQDLAVSAVEILKETSDLRLVILGKADSPKDPFFLKLKEQVDSSHYRDRVAFLETEEDVEDLIHGFDIVLSCSRSESFGLVILESMIAGVPVVATPTRGATLLLDSGSCGFIARGFEAESIAEAIKECLSQEQSRSKKVAAAKNRASLMFTLKRMVEKTESLYRELI